MLIAEEIERLVETGTLADYGEVSILLRSYSRWPSTCARCASAAFPSSWTEAGSSCSGPRWPS